MTSAANARRFSGVVLNAVSPETRKSLHAFAESIAYAEGGLREYHAAVPSMLAGQAADPMVAIRANARLVFTMTWAKAVLFSRAVIDCVNDGNLLVAFQSLRGYVELVVVVRFTVKQIEPLVRDAVASGSVSHTKWLNRLPTTCKFFFTEAGSIGPPISKKAQRQLLTASG